MKPSLKHKIRLTDKSRLCSESRVLSTMRMRKRKQQKERRSYFDPIPVDLVVTNIFSRLPVKSMAQCRCVSKLWSSLIRRENYNQLFPIKSTATPRILFAFNVGSKLLFYSAPQPQNPDNGSSLVATAHHNTYLGRDFYKLCGPVRGLVCSQHVGGRCSWAVISNPTTGEYVTTPKVSIENVSGVSGLIERKAEYCFGYDPIDKQFKVFRITWFRQKPFWFSKKSDNWYAKYHVLTLGTGNKNHLLWRKVQHCSAFHYPLEDNGICIDGVLYYPAMIDDKKLAMVCFDVRSEKFSFVNLDQDLATKIDGTHDLMDRTFFLINYKGKLGCSFHGNGLHHELWVLEDAEKHKWSKHIYDVLHSWLMVKGFERIGMAGRRDPFFVFYYNLETKIITRARLEVRVVQDTYNSCRVYTFLNYVEDVKLM